MTPMENSSQQQVISNSRSPRERKRTRDLSEGTAAFGEKIVEFAKTVPNNSVTAPLIGQLVRSGTSPGANYGEADEAVSRKDFRHRIAICKKEARETKHWLRMIVAAEPELRGPAKSLWQEAKELHMIFAAIYRNTPVAD